jgi:fumarate reductase flavoprotein subunit
MNARKLVALVLSAVMALGLLSGVALAQVATGTATLKGFGGDVTVMLSVEGDKLTEVVITGEGETQGIGETAIKAMAAAMLETNSIEVDVVAGATITSKAILEAAAQALAQTGAVLVAVESSDSSKTAEDVSTDVVVIGGGLGGMSAAFTLKESGKDVIVVEKRAMTGGNSATAGKFDAGGSKVQQELGTGYTAEDHYDSVYAEVSEAIEVSGAGSADFEPFVKLFTSRNGSYIDWLVDDLGVTVGSVSNGKEINGVPGKRISTEACTLLAERIGQMGVELRLSTPATELIADETGKVVGVKVESQNGAYNIYADAVILASGGFAADYDLTAEFVTGWEGKPTSNTDATTGDGIKMARAIGAKLTNMDSVTLNPTFHTTEDGATYSRSGTRYAGGILVDKTNGERFCDEMGDYSAASLAELALPEQSAWVIMDGNSVNSAADCVTAPTLKELAETIGVPAENLTATVERYNMWYDQGKDEDFGKTDFRARLESDPWYAMDVFPGVHNTHGGVAVDIRSQVLDTQDQPIPGLYAAGDVCDVLLFGAEALTAAGVFGQNAAMSALEDMAK